MNKGRQRIEERRAQRQADLQEANSAFKQVLFVFALIALVLAAVAVFKAFFKPDPKRPIASDLSTKAQVTYACRGALRANLNDPDSAEWLDSPDSTPVDWATVAGKWRLTATIRVRAKNGFGALVVNEYYCEALEAGDSWMIVGLREA
ncbi:hypothetical protein HCH_02910 [Hahella chejuensis KCTC 2396]|uniref:Uncharacterized protein n=1 Tax=Hahella chejuensis (strain KCTC 2396) TaxID=349521 RepID=Q2SI40_HAHCH|nr:hypothetical protein [Hahella chejuensis]ABC29684.1 hypothetical protein HCH_02910 [Hahella chejuensis KCTC 2396]